MPSEHYTGEPPDRDDPSQEIAATEDETGALRKERDELHDRWLRSVAEFDNYRRRTERERRERGDAANADLVRDLLPILDNFERALASAPAAGDAASESLYRGVELIYKQLLDAIKKRGAEPFDSLGEKFDPTWHEAVMHEPAGDRPEGEITGELRRGYRIGSRLLRPAQVKVTKA